MTRGGSIDEHSKLVKPAGMAWWKVRCPGCGFKPLLFDRSAGLLTALFWFSGPAVLPPT